MTAVEMPKVAIAGDFLVAFAKIPKKQQKKVQEFISKFRQNPTSSGINYEKIRDAKSTNVHSVRIDNTYRGIVLKPEKGNLFMLMWVAHHDDAYDWARRHDCQIHPSTGAIQIIDVSNVEAVSIEKPVVTEVKKALFNDYSPEQIMALGVPESFVDSVLAVTSEKDLEQLESRLPSEAYEPLFLLAAGEDYDELLASYNEVGEEVVDTDDFEAALDRTATQRNFRVVTDDLELQNMMNAPLEKWRVFLHPSQRKLVTRQAKGPTRVLGGAGTGKTVVAMHRAVWLASQMEKTQSGKILFTTFTRNLAADIKANLKKIASEDEMSRIEVTNIDGWITRFLKRFNYDFKVVYETDKEREICWKYALDQAPAQLGLPESFYEEEWRHIIQANSVKTKADYFKVSRVGRGTPLSRIQRAKIWPVFEEFRNQMNRKRIREMNDAMLDAIKILEEQKITLPYSSIIVDEAQDMGSQAFTLLRTIVPEQANDMFIVGDGHQRIYRNKVVLGRCGINVRGRRSQKLKINYRTTEETRRFATSVLENVVVDNLDGEQDKSSDYMSLFHGNAPVLKLNKTFEDEVDFIKYQVDQLIEAEVPLQDICLVARTKFVRDNYAKALREKGIETYSLATDSSDSKKPGLRVATMHRVKGLEFQYIFIAGANQDIVPLKAVLTEDPVERRDYDFNERALLHVAATRAIKGLYVTASNKPSPYIADLV
ncbi:UvrD-helicase domain-containing protein [Photobacterium rosenbergii]|uniref:UvrD-helicase domain-containing protein n=1 Tax=Photobacterium rosenbergii TaxID=294936 RepID=UPI001C99092A|nr:UvrD-helicase domain-containing protein [Photobacterium rosenbergii]MBY5946834.1 UvrD-helicase domain-containing protein [Photobacterium rosenbergii]